MSYSEREGVLLNQKFLRHSMNRIQSKTHIIGTYEINKNSLSCLTIKYPSKRMDMMDWLLFIKVNYKKLVILITIQNNFSSSCKNIIFIFSLVRTTFLSGYKI